MATLTGRSPKDTYGDLLQVSNANDGVDSTLRFVSDGKGTNSSLKISSASAQFTGTLTSTGLLTTTAGIVSGSNIISDADSTDDLGSTGVRWANLWVDNITMGGTIAGAVATFSSTMTVTGLTTATGGIFTSGTIIFEGATADAHETTLTVVDPTADRTVSLPNATDTLVGKATTDTLTNKTLTSPVLNTGLSGTAFLDEDDMSSNSATKAASQQSIKAYVDAQVDTADTLSEILAIGNTTGGTDVSVSTDDKVQFRDAAIYINSSTDGQLDIVADTEIQIAATTIDINGAVALNGALTGITNITLSGELDAATGDFSGDVDVDGTLEADAITLGGTALGSLYSPIAGSSSIVTTGALNSGSITSGFGTINNGASSITTTGALGAGAATFAGNVTHGSAAYVTQTDYGTSANSRIITGGTNTATGYLAVAQWNGSAYVNTVSFSGSDNATTFVGEVNVGTTASGDGTLNIIASTGEQSIIEFSDTTNSRGRIYYDHASSPEKLILETTGTTALSIDNSQNATFAGNIDAVAGGINLGATGSANLLDDYEHGEWTPTVVGSTTAGTYTVATGSSARYEKIGRLVHVGAKITFDAAGSGGGAIILGGLPFNYASGSLPSGTYLPNAISLPIGDGGMCAVMLPITSGADSRMVLSIGSDGAGATNILVTGLTTSSQIYVDMTYRV
jgi:cytoskeletal protein CcmA (bactofilin family)